MQNPKYLENHSFAKYPLKYKKKPMMSMSDHTTVLVHFWTEPVPSTIFLRVS